MGPMIKAEVGDTIEVVFKNLATRPYSVHPHGILYRYIWLLIRIHSCSLCTLGEVNEVYSQNKLWMNDFFLTQRFSVATCLTSPQDQPWDWLSVIIRLSVTIDYQAD